MFKLLRQWVSARLLLTMAVLAGSFAALLWLRTQASPGTLGEVVARDSAFRDVGVPDPRRLLGSPLGPGKTLEASAPIPLGGDADLLILLFVDGLVPEILDAELAAGRMPNLQHLLQTRPSRSGPLFSSFPSSTSPALGEMLTGRWSNEFTVVPARIHGFDRLDGAVRRYELEAEMWDGMLPNLFDRVAEAGGESVNFSLGEFASAALNVRDEAYWVIDAAADMGGASRVFDYDRHLAEDLISRMSRAQRPPNMVLLRLGNPDTQGHLFGPNSPEYAEALWAVDDIIGQLVEVLEYAHISDGTSLADRAHFVVFGDHSLEVTTDWVDLDAVLLEAGLDPIRLARLWSSVTLTLLPDGAAKHDAAAVPAGSNVAEIHLRDRTEARLLPWAKHPPRERIEALPLDEGRVVAVPDLLAQTPGIEFVMYQVSDHVFRVLSSQTSALIERRLHPTGQWELAYRPDDPQVDLFGFCSGSPSSAVSPCCEAAGTEACWATPDEWFDRTWDSKYPGAPFLVAKALEGDPRSRPDLIVTADVGYGFMEGMKGNHGGLRAESVWTRLTVVGDRVDTVGPWPKVRLIDLFPTLLDLLGQQHTKSSGPGGRVVPLFDTSTVDHDLSPEPASVPDEPTQSDGTAPP